MTDLVERLRACENDPMWADHAEIPKLWCKQAADEIERLRAVIDLAAKSLTAACLWRPSLSDAVDIARKSGPSFPEQKP